MQDDQKKAEERTKWAEDRTIMATERTYSSWLGAGMGAVGLALGLRALFGEFEPTWAPRLVAEVFVLAGVLIIWAGHQNACKTLDRLNDHAAEPQGNFRMTLIAVALTLGSVATGVILWFL